LPDKHEKHGGDDGADRNEPAMIGGQAVHLTTWATFGRTHKGRGAGASDDPRDQPEAKDKEEQRRSSHIPNLAPFGQKAGKLRNYAPKTLGMDRIEIRSMPIDARNVAVLFQICAVHGI
jgi:hypothetical protein